MGARPPSLPAPPPLAVSTRASFLTLVYLGLERASFRSLIRRTWVAMETRSGNSRERRVRIAGRGLEMVTQSRQKVSSTLSNLTTEFQIAGARCTGSSRSQSGARRARPGRPWPETGNPGRSGRLALRERARERERDALGANPAGAWGGGGLSFQVFRFEESGEVSAAAFKRAPSLSLLKGPT